jgi:C-terminal processing protease CtpA/Prc
VPDLGINLDTKEAKFPIIDFYSMKADPALFYRRVETIFARLHETGSRGLIVDLRSNGGGNSLLGDILLAFITDKPYRPFARQELRASPECRAYYTRIYSKDDYWNRAMASVRDGERAAWWAEPHRPQPTKLRFTGPVAVLIGPGTFSSANILANAIQDYGLAELIGRDTAETPNNFGMPCPVVLPHTLITLDVPSNYFVRASGDEADHSDVHPNIMVARDETAERPSERDVEAADGWIEKTIAQSAPPSVPSPKSPVSPTPTGQPPPASPP